MTANVPSGAPVENFVDGTFEVTVTCKESCRVSTKVLIRSTAAKRLGFKNVKGKLVRATSKGKLDGRNPTKMSVMLTAEAKMRLPKAKRAVVIFGSVQAFPDNRPTVNYSVGWSSLLS